MKTVVVILITVLILSACSNKRETNIDTILATKVQPKISTTTSRPKDKSYTCEECVALLDKLVRSSDYDSYFKKNYKMGYSVVVNEATREKVTIQIMIENNVPIGWLELQINEGILNDVTNDPQEPKNVHGNAQVIDDFKQKCLHCCLD